MVVGHNPGIESLFERLTGKTRAFPTCGLAIIAIDADDWPRAERGALERFIEP
nr:hypothetical protein [uncultured bacterium]